MPEIKKMCSIRSHPMKSISKHGAWYVLELVEKVSLKYVNEESACFNPTFWTNDERRYSLLKLQCLIISTFKIWLIYRTNSYVMKVNILNLQNLLCPQDEIWSRVDLRCVWKLRVNVGVDVLIVVVCHKSTNCKLGDELEDFFPRRSELLVKLLFAVASKLVLFWHTKQENRNIRLDPSLVPSWVIHLRQKV